MAIFNLVDTQAEDDVLNIEEDYGVLVVKNDVPQVFIPISEDDIDDWGTFIRIDPDNAEEIRRTTDVYFGMVDAGLVFLVERKLF